MSVGVDIIEVARVRRALESRGSRFAGRIFTDAEVLQCESRRNKFQSYAARFAAKEAVAKLIGTGFAGFLPRDIEILNAEMGKPSAASWQGQGLRKCSRSQADRGQYEPCCRIRCCSGCCKGGSRR